MVHNSITEEVREIRHRLAAQFDNDVHRIGAELRRRQASSGRHVVKLPRRPPFAAGVTDGTPPSRGIDVANANSFGNVNSPPSDLG